MAERGEVSVGRTIALPVVIALLWIAADTAVVAALALAEMSKIPLAVFVVGVLVVAWISASIAFSAAGARRWLAAAIASLVLLPLPVYAMPLVFGTMGIVPASIVLAQVVTYVLVVRPDARRRWFSVVASLLAAYVIAFLPLMVRAAWPVLFSVGIVGRSAVFPGVQGEWMAVYYLWIPLQFAVAHLVVSSTALIGRARAPSTST